MPKVPKNSDGAIMLRMAAIDAKLTEIARSSREGVTFEKREAKAAPLRKELAELRQRLWGTNGSAYKRARRNRAPAVRQSSAAILAVTH